MNNNGDGRRAAASRANCRNTPTQSTSSIALEPLYPESAPPAAFWEIDWQRVEADEHWRVAHWRVFADIEFTSAPVIANGIEYRACRPRPAAKAGGALECFGPNGARHIAGTLLRRCAGYREAPRARDIAAALRSDSPDELQARALRIYLYEASAQDVLEAWKAGEFSLHALMSRARALFAEHAHEVPHSIRPWTRRVVARR